MVGSSEVDEAFYCDYCGRPFDPIASRWLCPHCHMKSSCCEGSPANQPLQPHAGYPTVPSGWTQSFCGYRQKSNGGPCGCPHSGHGRISSLSDSTVTPPTTAVHEVRIVPQYWDEHGMFSSDPTPLYLGHNTRLATLRAWRRMKVLALFRHCRDFPFRLAQAIPNPSSAYHDRATATLPAIGSGTKHQGHMRTMATIQPPPGFCPSSVR